MNDDCISNSTETFVNNDDIRDKDFNLGEYEDGSNETNFESDDVSECPSSNERKKSELNDENITTKRTVTFHHSEKIK